MKETLENDKKKGFTSEQLRWLSPHFQHTQFEIQYQFGEILPSISIRKKNFDFLFVCRWPIAIIKFNNKSKFPTNTHDHDMVPYSPHNNVALLVCPYKIPILRYP